MREKIGQIIDTLFNIDEKLAGKTALVGFDGFVDCIVRAIRKIDVKNNYTYFKDISEFGLHIIDMKEKSCAIELHEQLVKPGGNMPNTANAMGKIGVKVNCIGAMGYPQIHDVFFGISKNCSLFSVANPGYCTAIEFSDGKVMLSVSNSINTMNWECIKRIIGIEQLIQFFVASDLIGMFNWSEIYCSTSIWEGIIKDVLHHHTPNKIQHMYFDLSDCSKKDSSDIQYALKQIMVFNHHYNVTLSLNENEMGCIFRAICPDDNSTDSEYQGDMIYKQLGVDTLIVHAIRYSISWNKEGRHRAKSLYIKCPILSTGGGDNFNAGVCIAMLLGFDIDSCLILGNALSGFYVKNGYSADIHELIEYLEYWKECL